MDRGYLWPRIAGSGHTCGVRIATWNIRAGGGRRTEAIAATILSERPDVLVITEFRTRPGRALLEHLSPLGYHVESGEPQGHENCTCVLSRRPMERVYAGKAPKSLHRWVAVRIGEEDLTVLGLHVP